MLIMFCAALQTVQDIQAMDDTARMISISDEILSKRVKQPSLKIDIILNNVRYGLQKIKECDITTI